MIKIKKLTLISSLGRGAEFNAAAMRCGYDGFTTESFGSSKEINTARVPLVESNTKSRVMNFYYKP